MNRNARIGTILVAIGILIPLAVLPFVSGYSKEKNIIQNLYGVGIALGSEKQANGASPGAPAPEKKWFGKLDVTALMPRAIPFRFILAIGVVLLFAGVVHLDRARKREAMEDEDD